MGTLAGRHFLKEVDFTPPEWKGLLALAAELKASRASGKRTRRLDGKSIALIFEKTSTRTRSGFEVAAFEEGAHVTCFDPSGSQFGHKESIADTARVLCRLYDGIQHRGAAQANVETLARNSSVPVWNGLTDDWHPTQSLCDMFTMREASGLDDHDISFAYLGDARFNSGNSLLIAGAMMGMDVRIVAPAAFQPADAVVAKACAIAEDTGARITVTDDVASGVKGARFVHTDIWVSMGEPMSLWDERIDVLRPYQVNSEVMERTGVPAVQFMHCLPSYHDLDTSVAREVLSQTGKEPFEVTDEVFESQASIVFQQAENRMHTIKAVMVATLGG